MRKKKNIHFVLLLKWLVRSCSNFSNYYNNQKTEDLDRILSNFAKWRLLTESTSPTNYGSVFAASNKKCQPWRSYSYQICLAGIISSCTMTKFNSGGRLPHGVVINFTLDSPNHNTSPKVQWDRSLNFGKWT